MKMKNNSIAILYMNRRTKRKSQRRKQGKTKRKVVRRSLSKRKTHRKRNLQRGGDDKEFKSVLLSVMNDTYIPFLPTTASVNDKDLQSTYLQCVSAFDLLTIIGKNAKFAESKSISGIVKEVDTDSKEIFKLLGDLTKVPVSRKVMSNFMINCNHLKENGLLKQLREYILECENYLSHKYVNWYKVALGLITLDDEFESMILEEIKQRRIFLDTDKFKYGLEILLNDDKVKNMFKKRIIECGYKPQGFFDKLMGKISWDSYNECFKCSDNSCVVYLDDNYRSFLNKKHKIKSIDKIKILIYVELRLRALSKYITLEGLRIVGKKHSKVKSLLNAVYKDDMNRGRKNKNDLKQMVMKEFLGGAPDEGQPAPTPTAEPVTEPSPTPDTPTPDVSPTDTPAPDTPAPDTPAPDTPAPDTPPPDTPPPDTPTPDTPTPDTPSPDTPPPDTPTPDTPSPDTPPPDTPSPDTPSPDTPPPDTPSPDTPTPDTPAPDTPTPDTPAPDTPTPDTPAPDTPTPDTPSPDPIDEPTPEPVPSPEQTTEPGAEPGAEITPVEPQGTETQQMPQPQPEEIEEKDPILNEKTIKSTNIIYLTFNSTKSEGNQNIDANRDSIIKDVKQEVLNLTGAQPDTIKIYRVRFGPETTSVEVGIDITGSESLSGNDIKTKFVEAVIDGSIKEKLLITHLNLLKDIYFDGISKYPGIQDLPSQYKRVIVELPGNYPNTLDSRISFEAEMITKIQEILDPNLDLSRIHLERVSKVPDDSSRVAIQFLIMNSFNQVKTPNEIIMEFKEKYGDGTTDYARQYELANVYFGDPSIIIDGSESDKENTFEEEKNKGEIVDKITLEGLENKYQRTFYYGCNLALEDLGRNLISADMPLYQECEPMLNQYFNGGI